MPRHPIWRFLLLIALLLMIAWIAREFELGQLFSHARMQSSMNYLRGAASDYGWPFFILFCLIGIILTIFNLPTIIIVSIAAAIYGTMGAILAGLICVMLSNLIIYHISHVLGKDFIMDHVGRFLPVMKAWAVSSTMRDIMYARLMFSAAPPLNWILPWFSSRRNFLLGTLLGSIPHIIVWSWIGDALVSAIVEQGTLVFTSPEVMMALFFGVGLTLLVWIVKRWLPFLFSN